MIDLVYASTHRVYLSNLSTESGRSIQESSAPEGKGRDGEHHGANEIDSRHDHVFHFMGEWLIARHEQRECRTFTETGSENVSNGSPVGPCLLNNLNR